MAVITDGANPDGANPESFSVPVSGTVLPGFDRVVEAACANVATADDLGFQLAIWRDGQLVLDIAAGHADAERTKRQSVSDLAMTYSVSKGVLGLCVGLLIEQGELELGRPVASYWPEFGAEGKHSITLRQLLRHEAGLPCFDRAMSIADLSDWDLCVSTLAEQPPAWVPGSGLGYHALTLGYLVGEVIRRASGLGPADFFRQNIGEPLGLDAWFGAPPAELGRVLPRVHLANGVADAHTERLLSCAAGFAARAVSNPPVAHLDVPAVWQSEVPAVSLVSNASSLARCYSVALPGPRQLIAPATLESILADPSDGYDQVLVTQPSRFAGAFQLSSPRQPMLGSGSFGHDGYSGGLAFAHPESGTALAYLPGRPELRPTPHSRITRVLAALREAL